MRWESLGLQVNMGMQCRRCAGMLMGQIRSLVWTQEKALVSCCNHNPLPAFQDPDASKTSDFLAARNTAALCSYIYICTGIKKLNLVCLFRMWLTAALQRGQSQQP